jgi:hypothetical protein
MRKVLSLLCILLTAIFSPLHAASDTFMDYQNYTHGYCPECNCYPCQCNAKAAEEVGEEPGALPPPPCGPCGAAVPSAAFGVLPPPPPAVAAAAAEEAAEECEKPNPCDPAPVCATNCGISLCWIGLGIAVVATAAAIIVSTNNGRTPTH